MNDSTSAPTGATTKKTTRKRGGRGRKQIAPSDIAAGSTPVSKSTNRTAVKTAPDAETGTELKPASELQAEIEPATEPEAESRPQPRTRSRSRSSSRSSSRSGSEADSNADSEARPASSAAAPKSGTPSRMLINYVPGDECRVALTVDGKLEEFHSERANNLNIVGNIYVGKVMNVERSIQAAFIDFGYGVNGFLHISDLHPQYFPGEDENTTEKIGMKTPRRERPPIERCLKRGQKVIVQVLKEGISTKGPTLTSYLSIPGRFLVMLPDMDKVGVSRKVEDEDQRRAMRKILDSLDLPTEFGFILRTAGMNQTKAELKRDLAYLQRLWKDIDKRLGQGDKPRLLYAESDLLMRALRDIWTSDIDEIIVDDPGAIRRAYAFMRIVSPRSSTRLLAYDRAVPLFHAFGVEEQIERILSREVPLPSGGSLIIDEAEAMVAIDVNSGKSRNHGDAETMAYRTNREAVEEICRQIKLRDVGGLIMCDLIDMMKRSHRREIETLMEDLLRKDRASTRALAISEFGIMEMTRQRVRGSMKSVHFAKLDIGDGRGWVRRPDSVATNAMRDLAALMQNERVAKVEMVVSPRVAGELLSSQRKALTRLELKLHKSVDVRVSESIAVDRVVMYAYDGGGADIELERLPAFRAPTDLSEYRPDTAEDGDWSVDATAEHVQDLEELVHEEAVKLDEILAMEADLEDSDDSDHEQTSEDGGRKRRRRRRRRRGGGQREDGENRDSRDDADQQDQQRDDSEPSPEIVAEHDDSDRDQRSEQGESQSLDENGEPRKRRRRRRRRRGSGGGEGRTEGQSEDQNGDESDAPRHQSDSDDSHESEEPEQIDRRPAHVEPKAPVREGNAPSGFPWRGDSWDLEPSALTIDSNGGFRDPAAAKLAADLKAGREPQAAAQSGSQSGNQSGNGRVASERSSRPDEPRDASDRDSDGNDPNGTDGGGGRKRRRRRRGGRGQSEGGSREERSSEGSREPAEVASAWQSPKPPETKSEPAPQSRAPQKTSQPTVMPAPTPNAQRQTGRKVAAIRRGQKKAPADILIAAAVKPVAKVMAKSETKAPRKAAESSASSSTTKKTTKKASTTKKVAKKPAAKKATTKKTTTKKASTKKTTTKKAGTKKKTTKKASS